MHELEVKISEIKEKLHLKEMLRHRIEEVNENLDKLEKRLTRQYAIVNREYQDINLLEEKSTSNIFFRLMNNIEEQLEKERQEYLMAVLLYNNISEEITVLKYEKTLLENKFNNIQVSTSELENLLKIKEQKLHFTSHASLDTLKNFNRQIDNLKSRSLEIDEALSCCDEVRFHMESIYNNLKKVSHWGVMTAGTAGTGSTYKKIKYIDENRKLIAKVNTLINKLYNEIADVYPEPKIQLHIQDYHTFVELFYDHMITDWILRRKMNNALQNIHQNMDKLSATSLMLSAEKSKGEEKIATLVEEKRMFLLSL